MRVWWPAICALAVLSPACLRACEPASPDANQVLKANLIVRGRVVGSHWEEPASLLVSVAVDEVLKGHAQKALNATSPCALPVKNGEAVVVINGEGRSLVYPIDIYEKDLRSALNGVRR
jgi:hypothetical protein